MGFKILKDFQHNGYSFKKDNKDDAKKVKQIEKNIRIYLINKGFIKRTLI